MKRHSATQRTITMALATDVVLVCLEGSIRPLHNYLPIGNSPLAQMGFLLGIAVAFDHIYSSFRRGS
jgi:hypothetical protein